MLYVLNMLLTVNPLKCLSWSLKNNKYFANSRSLLCSLFLYDQQQLGNLFWSTIFVSPWLLLCEDPTIRLPILLCCWCTGTLILQWWRGYYCCYASPCGALDPLQHMIHYDCCFSCLVTYKVCKHLWFDCCSFFKLDVVFWQLGSPFTQSIWCFEAL